MNLFAPRTFSTDWEIMVMDRLNRVVSTEKIMGFAGALQAEFLLPIIVDLDALELPLGVNISFPQFRDRILRVTDRATAIFREYDLDLFPAAAHPTERLYNSSHIHVGTLTDESAGLLLENRLLRFVPAFAALAANSPLANGMRGAFKSYRVRYQANENIRPNSRRDPRFEQAIWGLDAGTKLYAAPTLEVRVLDCASSRLLLAEMGAFVAAFVQMLGGHETEEELTPELYREYLVNRWTAARDGLQATFTWQGEARPVVDLLGEMLDACKRELEKLEATRWDFPLIGAMLEKRLCQADFARALADRYPEPHVFTSAYAKLIRHWDAFDTYLERAPALDPLPPLDEDAILAAHVQAIGEGTHFYRTREVMSLPPAAADAIMERMIRDGLVTRDVTPERGVILSRTGGERR